MCSVVATSAYPSGSPPRSASHCFAGGWTASRGIARTAQRGTTRRPCASDATVLALDSALYTHGVVPRIAASPGPGSTAHAIGSPAAARRAAISASASIRCASARVRTSMRQALPHFDRSCSSSPSRLGNRCARLRLDVCVVSVSDA